MIVVKNKRCKRENIEKEFPGCVIYDVTSKGEMKRFSPFYPHGCIPIPFSQGAQWCYSTMIPTETSKTGISHSLMPL